MSSSGLSRGSSEQQALRASRWMDGRAKPDHDNVEVGATPVKPMSPAATSADIEALDAQAQRLMAAFARAGYERIAPAVIQPAGLFLDVVGESLARAHLRLHRSRRRGIVPAPRPHRAHLPPAPGAPRRRQRRQPATATRAPPSATSRPAPTARTRASSARPASSRSPRPTARQDDAAVLALIVAALREAGLDALAPCGSATSACSPR